MRNLLIIVVILIGFIGNSLGQSSCLIAKYSFTGNAKDSSGNGHDLTVNGATLTKDRFGNINQAYHFNGTQYLYGTATPAFSNDEFSTAFWVKPETGNNGDNRILAVGPGGSYWHYYSNVSISAINKFGFIGTDVGGNYTFYNYVNPAYVTNKWVHIVSTYKGDSIKMYVNGVLNFTSKNAAKVTKFTSNQYIQIGAALHPNSAGAGFKGDLDDIRIYCKALDKTEVMQLYSGCNLNFVSEPSNQNVNLGTTAKFKVVSSDTNATYQWQINNGSGYTNLSDAGQYSGSKTNELIISNCLFASNNNLKYLCIVTNSNCSITSKEVLLTVKCVPLILKGPVNANVGNKSDVKMSVVSGFNSFYKWQINQGSGFGYLSNGGQFEGVTLDTLKIKNVTLANTNQKFRCVANYEGCSDTSAFANLTVYCIPIIKDEPVSKSVSNGSDVKFNITSFEIDAAYQWQANIGFGLQNIINAGQFSGANTDTLIVKNLNLANDNQNFRCIVKSGLCYDTSKIVILSVEEKLSITNIDKPYFSVFPNPANDFIRIENIGSLQQSDFNIVDLQGRVVFEGTINSLENMFEIKHLIDGIYILRIGLDNIRIIKQ